VRRVRQRKLGGPFRSRLPLSSWTTLTRCPSSHEVGLLFRGSGRQPVGPYLGFGPPPAAFLGSWGLPSCRLALWVTTALASLELRPPLQSMAGGGRQAHTGRARQASLGFLPLQRMRSRRSTNPGFPSPGLFPSQRFSRSQGVTPSKTLAGLFHPANAPGVPPNGRPRTSGSRGTRVLKAPQTAQLRRAESPGPAQSVHPKAHGQTGRWNLSGRDSVFGAQERGVKPSTWDDDHRRVEPQMIHSPLNSGKPELPISEVADPKDGSSRDQPERRPEPRSSGSHRRPVPNSTTTTVSVATEPNLSGPRQASNLPCSTRALQASELAKKGTLRRTDAELT